MKRSIKFDDNDMDLVLDFNTDPSKDGWKRVTAAQAKEMSAKLPKTGTRTSTVTNLELEDLVDVS